MLVINHRTARPLQLFFHFDPFRNSKERSSWFLVVATYVQRNTKKTKNLRILGARQKGQPEIPPLGFTTSPLLVATARACGTAVTVLKSCISVVDHVYATNNMYVETAVLQKKKTCRL